MPDVPSPSIPDVACEHIRLVCEYVLTVDQDPRISGVLAALSGTLVGTVVTLYGVHVRQGPGLNYKIVGSLRTGSTFVVLSRVGDWGNTAPERWVTLDPRYVSLSTKGA
jgi:hypothetical protein